MITKKESIPQRTKLGLYGQDVLYEQFNDIRFYVEDTDQEQLYFVIIRKLFPKIRLSKIFPLGGKKEVISKAQACNAKKGCIFILDKDFDDILRKKTILPNLFYLRQYSIENYLLEQGAICDFIVEEKPRLKKVVINSNFDIDAFINERVQELIELFTLFLVAQDIGYINCKLPPERFVKNSNKYEVDPVSVDAYRVILKEQFSDERQFDEMRYLYKKKAFKASNISVHRRHICGKYLCFMTKNKLCSKFHLKSISNDSFCYRLAKNCHFGALGYLQKSIRRFLEN